MAKLEGETGSPADLPERELLWRQYALHVDLYKFHLDLSVKINVFYYAVTGAILTYYFQNNFNGVAKYALLLPIAFSLALSGLLFYGAQLLGVTRQQLFAIRDRLNLETAPEMQVLVVFLRLFAVILAMTGTALLIYFCIKHLTVLQSRNDARFCYFVTKSHRDTKGEHSTLSAVDDAPRDNHRHGCALELAPVEG
jgi:hypothetical protein